MMCLIAILGSHLCDTYMLYDWVATLVTFGFGQSGLFYFNLKDQSHTQHLH